MLPQTDDQGGEGFENGVFVPCEAVLELTEVKKVVTDADTGILCYLFPPLGAFRLSWAMTHQCGRVDSMGTLARWKFPHKKT